MVLVSFATSNLDLATRLHLIHVFDESAPIKVPIHLTIAKVAADRISAVDIYDADIETVRHYNGTANSNETEVVAVNLQPGLYKFTGTALDGSPELRGFPANLEIEYKACVQFIPYAITPKER
jgi:hypothetical protein